MNIAICSKYGFNPQVGGIETVSCTLARCLRESGYKVFFISRRVKPSQENTEEDVFYLPKKRPILCRDNEQALVEFLKVNSINLLLVQHSYKPNLCRLFAKTARTVGAKIVYAIHTTPDFNSKKILEMQRSDIFLPHLNLFEKLQKFVRYALKPIYVGFRDRKLGRQWRLIHSLGDAVVLLSESYKDIFSRLAGLRGSDKIYAIGNANKYDVGDLPIDMKKENLVLFVGRLSEEKNPDKLLKVWSCVEDKFPDWRLELLGDGKMYSSVESLRDALGLQRCVLRGRQNPKTYYERAKIIASLSNFEGFPLNLTEAMQHGCVPVAFDTFASYVDIIDYGKAGVAVCNKSIEDFSIELSLLMSDSRKWQEMSRQARLSVLRYDREEIVKQWIMLFEKL